jgi:hypothetical protein
MPKTHKTSGGVPLDFDAAIAITGQIRAARKTA